MQYRQPPCEAVSWNTNINPWCNRSSLVSLLVRLWVEITGLPKYSESPPSASLWGCELKCNASSWHTFMTRQPPCEAVSWNMAERNRSAQSRSQPPCEAVSWNDISHFMSDLVTSQPPCEAVSWNYSIKNGITRKASSASLWGCELKFYNNNWKNRNHRQPPCEAVSWNHLKGKKVKYWSVSLLVRLWVEMNEIWILLLHHSRQPSCEAVSWNDSQKIVLADDRRQPPCEAVSWNCVGCPLRWSGM